MELKRYAALLWRWAWLIVIGTILAGGAAFGVSRYTTPIYQASTTLLINQAPASSASFDYNTILTSERLARTYAEWLRKRPVLEEVIRNLALDLDATRLVNHVRVTAVRDTQFIVVTVEDPDPHRAADIANEIVAVFSEQNRELQASRYAASKQSLEQELSRLQADIDNTQARIAELQAVNDPFRRDEHDRLQALLTQQRGSYTTLLESFEKVRLAEAQTTDSVSVIEEAVPQRNPIRPRTLTNTLLGALVGALLAVGGVFLIEYLDDSVKSREEVEALTELSTLATIAQIRGKDLPETLVSATSSRSPIAEAYRLLRTNMEFASGGDPLRTLVVTSSGPTEGKSTTIANLAIVLAQAGKRVILVDTDLRRPSLHKFFQRTNIRGFTTALLRPGEAALEDCLVPTSVPNLRLMPSGPLPPNPAELLGSRRMSEMIAELQTHADMVLFDSPPLLAVTDATLLARACDAALLVVQASATRASALRRAREQLLQSGTRVLGVILNRVTATHGGYDDYYQYYYYGDGRQSRRTGEPSKRNGQTAHADHARPFQHNGTSANGKEHAHDTRRET